jgi:2-polyprenyl-3-methyl-5-hydroxy-6-metoxy-1,4-benzoquinol methylase
VADGLYVQRDQPPGVPPLALDGERTLPGIPEENYWFQRHVAVYAWVAEQVAGRRVIDMACGEGYGADLLAERAASVVGVEANPDAFEHARLRYVRPNLRFERSMVEVYAEPCDAIVFLQTIEHVQDPGAVLDHFAAMLVPGGAVFISTPNVLTLAPAGAERSGNPWHLREYRPDEFAALCRAHFRHVELYGLFHARRLAVHQVAIERLGWDAIHRRLRITKPFYDRFVPAISARDFALRARRDLSRALDLVAVLRLARPVRARRGSAP